MSFVSSPTFQSIAQFIVLALVLTTQSQSICADERSKMKVGITKGGNKADLNTFDYQGTYTYYGPDSLDVYGMNQVVRFGKLREGFALPIAGAIYRVDEVDPRYILFDKVPERELPSATKLTAGSYALPLNSTGQLNSWDFKIERIAKVEGRPQVTIIGFNAGHSLGGTYRIGESLNADRALHRIVNIVPPYDRFEGWVEIDMKARKGPLPPQHFLAVLRVGTSREILLDYSTRVGGNVFYRDPKQRQAVVEFLTKHEGFKVAFLGKIYKVTHADEKSIKCELVPDAELPAKSVPRAGNYLFSIGLPRTLNDWDCRVAEIVADGATLNARFEGLGEAKGDLGTYKVGEDVVFNGTPYRVASIVPSDAGGKLIGWVEVAPISPAK